MLKHLCQIAILDKLKEKDKGFSYIDTHSGAGVYNLDSEQAKKTNEFRTGISRLQNAQFTELLLTRYLDFTKGYQKFARYPGSPEIARQMVRAQDDVTLMEWHNTEVENLKRNVTGKNVVTHHRNGFEGIVALTPPRLKRGLVLIDPSYELIEDYQDVFQSVCAAYQRWPNGIYAIWYPLIAKRDTDNADFSGVKGKTQLSEKMLDKLSTQPFKNLLRVELHISDKQQSEGMYGSGMAIINAPWMFEQTITQALQQIAPLMADSNQASISVDWLIEAS